MLNYALIKREYLVTVREGKVVDGDMTQCPNWISTFFSREYSVSPLCQGRRSIWVSAQLSISLGI